MMIHILPYGTSWVYLYNQLDKYGKADAENEVMRKAIKEAAPKIKESLYKETRERYTIKRGQFRKSDIKQRGYKTLEVSGAPLGVWEGYQSKKNTKKKGAKTMVLKGGAMKELVETAGGRQYKGFLTTVKNAGSDYTGIFQRMPGKYMDESKRPQPTKRVKRKKKRKPREAIQKIYSLAKSKAVEVAYREKGYAEAEEILLFHMQKSIDEVIGGIK